MGGYCARHQHLLVSMLLERYLLLHWNLNMLEALAHLTLGKPQGRRIPIHFSSRGALRETSVNRVSRQLVLLSWQTALSKQMQGNKMINGLWRATQTCTYKLVFNIQLLFANYSFVTSLLNESNSVSWANSSSRSVPIPSYRAEPKASCVHTYTFMDTYSCIQAPFQAVHLDTQGLILFSSCPRVKWKLFHWSQRTCTSYL